MITSERLDAEKMEIQMKGRIAELEKANQALRAELLERSYSEEALRKSEEKYRMLFNSIGDGFFLIEVIFDSKEKPVDYKILEANQSHKKVTGLRDVEGKQIRKLFPDMKDDFVKIFGQVALTGDSVRFESRVESVARWFDIYASRIGDEYSRKVAVLFKDITERKKAEKDLKEAYSVLEEKVKERTVDLEKAYDLLKESGRSLAKAQKMAHVGNWSRNIETGEVHWSDEVYRIFGFKPQEFGVTYNEFLSHVHPEDQDFLIEASKQALKGKLSSIDYRIVRSTGEERIVHEEVEVVFDENNIPVHLRGTVQDITESKKAEQELIRAKEELAQRATDKYLMLFNSIDEGYALCEVIYDADGKASNVRYLEVNSAFGKLSGMKDLKGKTMRQLVPYIESVWIENAAKVVETGEAFHFEGYVESLGCWADLRFLRIGDEISHTIAIIFNNITENRLAEHKIYRYNRVLEGINKIFSSVVQAKTEEEMGNACLSVALEVTDSQFGFINEMSADGLLHDVAKSELAWEQCFMYDKSGHSRPLSDFAVRGLYGIVINDKKSFFTNDPQSHPDSIGLPYGHPLITSFLGVPLVLDEKIMGIIGVANREGGYSSEPQEDLEKIASAVVQALHRKKEEKERTRMEEALQKSEENVRQRLTEIENLYRNAPVGLCELDRELRYVHINERLAEFNGFSAADHIGKRLRDIIPQFAEKVEPKMFHVLETGEPMLDIEIVGETMSQPGIERSWLEQWLPITDAQGLVTGLNIVTEETTTRKRAEEELLKAYEEIRDQSEEMCKINEELKVQSEELKEANDALSESEKRFRTLAENSPDIIVRLDRQKRITYANPAVAEIYGRSAEGVIGKTPNELERYHGQLNFWEKYYEKVLATGRIETVESQHVSSQGKKYYLNAKIVPEFVDGKTVSILEISRDITEQKKVEKELKLARDYNRSLIENNPDPLVTIGPDGKITDVNKATELVTGYFRSELIGTDFSDYFTEPERAREGYQQVFREGLVRDYPLEIRHKDRHITPVLYNASVYRNENGEIIGVFAAARDITELKKARENIQSLANIVESSNDAIITESLDGTITSWNKGAEQIYGYLAEEVLGKNRFILEPDNLKGEVKQLSDQIKQGKKVRHHETLGLKKDGTIVDISVTLSPVIDTSGKLVAISNIAGDITEKRIAENLLHEKQIAEVANRTKSEFLANMSHELRTPLNSIIGFSDMLYEQAYGEMNKRQLRAVVNVSNSGKHLLNLINGILDLSKIEAKKMELDYREFELTTKLNLIRNILLPIADKKNVRIELDMDNELTRICADEEKFVRIMYNLVDNAIKFSYENSFVKIRTRKKGDMVEITVKDNGIGIKTEDQHKLFKPFSQVDTFPSKKYQGTGLGLSLVKQIVHLHGGYVWFGSNPGEGSTFAFVIPIKTDLKVLVCCH